MTPELQSLTDRLARAEARQLQSERDAREARRRARVACALACVAVGLTLLLNVRPAAWAQTPGVSLAALLARLSIVEQKTAPITVKGTDLTFTGVNVHIVSGSGSTNDGTADGSGSPIAGTKLTGLGNLIVGYNNAATTTGSHNLILGDGNTYSSYGGLVAGNYNTVSAPYAAVTGGYFNTAAAPYAAVTGGFSSTAAGYAASISGGFGNYVIVNYGWAGGGYHTP